LKGLVSFDKENAALASSSSAFHNGYTEISLSLLADLNRLKMSINDKHHSCEYRYEDTHREHLDFFLNEYVQTSSNRLEIKNFKLTNKNDEQYICIGSFFINGRRLPLFDGFSGDYYTQRVEVLSNSTPNVHFMSDCCSCVPKRNQNLPSYKITETNINETNEAESTVLSAKWQLALTIVMILSLLILCILCLLLLLHLKARKSHNTLHNFNLAKRRRRSLLSNAACKLNSRMPLDISFVSNSQQSPASSTSSSSFSALTTIQTISRNTLHSAAATITVAACHGRNSAAVDNDLDVCQAKYGYTLPKANESNFVFSDPHKSIEKTHNETKREASTFRTRECSSMDLFSSSELYSMKSSLSWKPTLFAYKYVFDELIQGFESATSGGENTTQEANLNLGVYKDTDL
jgi:hypothetical protein